MASDIGPAGERDEAVSDRPICRPHRLRMRFVRVAFLVAFLYLAFHLVQLQVDPDLRFSEEDLKQIWKGKITIPRGKICDRDGGILARDRTVFSLYADPRTVKEPEARELAQRLSVLLDVDEDILYMRLTRVNNDGKPMKFVWLKRWLTGAEAESVRALQAPKDSLGFEEERLRLYPEGILGSHVLGFANKEGVGSEGIEAAWDRHLRSTAGIHRARKDGKKRLLSSLTLEFEPPKGGGDVHLTLSIPIQHALERELAARMEECNAPRAMGIVMDPHSGAILALACLPSFDPNAYGDYDDELRKNRAVIDVFEPGSSFKIVTAAAALERGLITPDTIIDCESGSFNPYGHRIRDFHPLAEVPFSEAFAQSSNIGIIKVGALLGPELLHHWITRFGFGQQTSSDFSLESRGLFRPLPEWSGRSMGALPMGQEVAVTMPQLARAFSAVANGGILVEPYLVEHVTGQEGETLYEHDQSERKRIMSPETAATMRELCHLVVTSEHGTGRYANIEEYRTCGKTGTAQIARPEGGYYADSEQRFTAIFAGFAPLADPKICAVIVVQEPNIRLHYGGYVCGPVFKTVVREALTFLHCPIDPIPGYSPDDRDGEDESDPPPLVASAEAPIRDADTVGPHFDAESFEPPLEETMATLDDLDLVDLPVIVAGDGPSLPDLTGLTKRQAREKLAELGLTCAAKGSGWVVRQEPPAGAPLDQETVCRLTFERRRISVPDGDATNAEAPAKAM
jgi:cell division protein FtsI (penicillin-binding protein 3)